MVMETKNNAPATPKHAQLTVKEAGVSTVLAPPLAVVEFRKGCTLSREQPAMVATLAPRQVVPRSSMLAAQNHVRRTVRATGRTGVSAPMVAMVLAAQNVAQEANKVEFSRWILPPPRVVATATTNMVTWTPDPVTCLAAQKIVKVLGVFTASVS
jgi:hypothetical protein